MRLRLLPDQVVGHAQDVLGASVILLELDDPAAGVIVLEFEDVGEVRASPSVDRLVGVARHAEVGVVDRESADDGILGQVRVLIFVDQHVAIAAVEVGADVLVLLEDRDHVHEQVVEVDGGGLAEPLLVGL